ncbi:hypothetical protein KO498_12230 [Lentibacter algarum]|uniref:calcium-binding protein n=1 Tax=Lentibacter algarum TaxID=576131 RepID=UPI001C086453|nr:hypothetical protein [Lentibacter algarum]MBU2982577.1 hypothetical protein [Lentibacter algarum]
MNTVLLLFAAMLIPLFEGRDDTEADTASDAEADAVIPTDENTDDDTEGEPVAELSAASDASGAPVVQGNDADNSLTQTSIMDFITGDATLTAAPAGTVAVNAGAGDDTVDAGLLDTPVVRGEAGDDVLTGSLFQGNGVAALEGGEGNDTITGTVSDISGGAGDDVLTGSGSGESGETGAISGGLGNDTISVGLLGNAAGDEGNDTITVTGLNATADGGAGDDNLTFAYSETTEAMPTATSPIPALDTGVELTGGEGADNFVLSGVFEEIDPATSASPALFATITDLDLTEDVIAINFDLGTNSLLGTDGVETFNKDISFVSTTSYDDSDNFDLLFTLSGENADGAFSQNFVIRLVGDIEFDDLSIQETENGLVMSAGTRAIEVA